MQIRGLHKNIYRLYAYARTQECLDAYRAAYLEPVRTWQRLKAENVSDPTCQEITGISRATYYRHKKILKDLDNGILPPSKRPRHVNQPRWGAPERDLVLRTRRDNPTYGKEKIAIILKRDHGLTLSQSTVGRILTHLKDKGLITKSPSALRTRRKRAFANGHAKPWTFKKYEQIQLGERVQIDHMTVTKNGTTVKHFQAWDRRSKFIHAQVFSSANSSCAKRFLLDFVAKSPFPVLSVQVDGGSEFMAHFEDACKELGIPLIVLPPRKPQYNGGVERANRTFREEFYARNDLLEDSVRGLNAALSKAVQKYNTFRPHRNLQGYTPMQYITSTLSQAS